MAFGLEALRANRQTEGFKPTLQGAVSTVLGAGNSTTPTASLTPVRDSGFGKSGPIASPPPPTTAPTPTPTPVRDSGFGKTGPIPNPPPPTPPMSTGYPPLSSMKPPIGTTPTPPNGTSPVPTNGVVVNSQVNPQELTSVNLQQLLQSNSPYIRAAERAGQRQAASRGLLNSSMAAGAARRSAIEAGGNIAESDAQAYRGAAGQTRDFLYRDALANNDTARQDWLASSAYTRDFNGRLAMMPLASSFDFFNSAMQAALQDPSIYPPEVVNSLSQFNMQQLNQMIAQFLGNGRP